jgi:hypothetical protein
MNFDSDNSFDINEIIDHLDEIGHVAPSDDTDRAELFEEVQS